MVTAELAPLARTGGLGDAVIGLARALARMGRDVLVVTPQYGVSKIPHEAKYWDAPLFVGAPFFRPFGVLELPRDHGVHLCLVAENGLFGREGIYGDRHGTFGDNPLRFAFLSAAARLIADRVFPQGPSVVHAHDWHAGFSVLSESRGARTVFTIHNLAHQGQFGAEWLPHVLASSRAYDEGVLRHDGLVNVMKGAIDQASVVTTVSETYAKEIQEEPAGFGLAAHLRYHKDKLFGIVNGIDKDEYDPRADPALARAYDVHALEGRRDNQMALRQEMGLCEGPLFALVSRFVWQKGIDLFFPLVGPLVREGATVLFLGQGDASLEREAAALSQRFPGRVATRIAFDDRLSRRVFAGADFLVVPSRFEPCGLTQMYAMRYGAIPIVTPVGGLLDTVRWSGSDPHGFVAAEVQPDALLFACEEARTLPPHTLHAMRTRAMLRVPGWEHAAKTMLRLYSA